jgi:hypothetical protein
MAVHVCALIHVSVALTRDGRDSVGSSSSDTVQCTAPLQQHVLVVQYVYW